MSLPPSPSRRPGGPSQPAAQSGFTLIELITIIIILGILSLLLFTRTGSIGGQATARASEVRSQIRFVQLRAMKTGGVYGFSCDGTNYWAFSFNSTAPTSTASYLTLPGESASQVSIAGKSMTMTMTASPIFFDRFGIPYTAYNPAGTTTKLDPPTTPPCTITITSGGDNATLSITPETGYVQ